MHFRFTKQKNSNLRFLKAKASLERPHQTEPNYILLLVHWFVNAIYAFSLSSAIYLGFTKDMSGDPPGFYLQEPTQVVFGGRARGWGGGGV